MQIQAQAPDFRWVRTAGGYEAPPPYYGYSSATASAVSRAGNVYVVGDLRSLNPVFSDSNPTNSPTLGHFIANYNSEGDLIWTHSIGTNAFFGAVAVDSQGCVYAAGSAKNTNTFDHITLASDSQFGAVLLVKYDPAGNVLWATRSMNGDFSRVAAITLDAQDNLYMTGTYLTHSNIVFGSQMLTDGGSSPEDSILDVFTVKYAPTGEALWARRAVGLDEQSGCMITVDDAGNVFVASPFPGIADFGGVTVTNVGPMDYSLAKYNTAGDLLWAKRVAEGDFGYAQHAAADTAGNVYVSSFFYGETASFGNTTLTNTPNSQEIFLAKYDNDGNFLWVRPGISSDYSFARVGGICVDALGNSYFTGTFESSNLAFGDVVLFNERSGQMLDETLFVVKHDPDGNLLWAKTPPDAASATVGVGVDGRGNVYLSGSLYSGAWDFGSLNVTNNYGGGGIYTPPTLVLVARLDGPRLSISSTANQLTLSWPTNAAGLHLESAASLNGPWYMVANSVLVNSNQKTVTIETSSSSRFFRLNGP